MPGVGGRCPVVAITLGELVLTPTGLVSLCPVVGVPARGVPEGLANLEPCPAVVTTAGELVLTPAEVTMPPEVPRVDGILFPGVGVPALGVPEGLVVGVPLRGMPEGLVNLEPCPAVVMTAGELVLIPAEVDMPPEVDGIL